MNCTINKIVFKGEVCYEMNSSKYTALFCPGLGGNMLRLYDKINEFEVLHFDENITIQKLKQDICLYGLPTLYLPNRFHKGILKTSDNKYTFPINEPDFNNFIHGFLHTRCYKVTEAFTESDFCRITAEYDYNKDDEFYKYFPLDFKATIFYTLSDDDLSLYFKITNISEYALPVIVGSHTAINLPFSKDSSKEDLRIKANIKERVLLNKSLVSTGELLELSDYDLMFKEGTMNPLTTSIDNDMYTADNDKKDDKNNFVEIFDEKSKKGIRYETGQEFGFWLFWNHWGNAGFCCPEPMSSMINASNIPLPNKVTGYTEIKTGETWTGFQRLSTF